MTKKNSLKSVLNAIETFKHSKNKRGDHVPFQFLFIFPYQSP